jgi:exosortase
MVAPSVDHAPAARWRTLVLPEPLPMLLAGAAFVVLFITPFLNLVSEWWTDPDAGHGLLLFPVAIWLAWREGIAPDARPNARWGVGLLIAAVFIRALGSAAAELFTQRFSIWLAAFALIVFWCGWTQIRRWWLPLALLVLTIPLPAILTNMLATPLQFRASAMATSMIRWRHIPVLTTGNVINIPGQRLFVAEACSGLRSLTALLSLGVLIGGMYLRTTPMRLLLVLLAIPVAVFVNAVRIFFTAFLAYYVDPKWAAGDLHRNEGWAMFVIALAALAAIASIVRIGEDLVTRRRSAA